MNRSIAEIQDLQMWFVSSAWWHWSFTSFDPCVDLTQGLTTLTHEVLASATLAPEKLWVVDSRQVSKWELAVVICIKVYVYIAKAIAHAFFYHCSPLMNPFRLWLIKVSVNSLFYPLNSLSIAVFLLVSVPIESVFSLRYFPYKVILVVVQVVVATAFPLVG